MSFPNSSICHFYYCVTQGYFSQAAKVLLASSNYYQCPRQWKLKFSYIVNDCQLSLKFGAHQESRNTPNFPDLSPTIPDSWQSLWFQVSFVGIIWDFPDFPGIFLFALLKENCSLTF